MIKSIKKYEKEKEKVKIITCEKCKKGFFLKDVEVKNTSLNIKGEVIFITYFTCPYCEKLYIVSIDNAVSMNTRTQLEELINRVEKAKLKEKSVDRSKLDKIEKLRKQVQRINFELKHKYDGEFYLLDSDEN